VKRWRSASGISEENEDNRGIASVAFFRADSHSGLACDIKFRSDIASTRILLLSCGGQMFTVLFLL
jgi:hypothetical protein